MANILFVCSRNKLRSPTGEAVFSCEPGINARSAGLSPDAEERLGVEDVEWADIIFVMECKHIFQLEEQYEKSRGKTFLLGGLFQEDGIQNSRFQNNNAIEISDPYNQPTAIYEDAFKKVNRCITTMRQLLTSKATP